MQSFNGRNASFQSVVSTVPRSDATQLCLAHDSFGGGVRPKMLIMMIYDI